MPIFLTMPRLSDTMEAGTVIKWNVKEGDKVRSGDLVADIETDKATMEMQCFDDGTVAKILVETGKLVKVGTKIAVIASKNEDAAAIAAQAGDEGATGEATPPAVAPAATAPKQAPAPVAAAAPATPAAPSTVPPAGNAPQQDGQRLRVSPVARRIAEDSHLDLRSVRGSGPGGRIIKRDVIELAEQANTNAASAESASLITPGTALALNRGQSQASPANALQPLTEHVVPLSGMRQTIARRLVESKTTIPHYQVTMKFAMDELLQQRKNVNEALAGYGVKVSVNDFLVRACALAMYKHPFFNASFGGDHLVVHGDINIGMAISLPEERGGGLVVGVIKNADQKTLRQISADAKYLAEKARTKGLSLDEMNSATFTISNLGMFGVEHFTAIINPPNSAIMACGAAIEQPVVRNHQLVVGWEMQVTLSLDHRVIDGAMAAEYLGTLKELIEKPAALMV
ncbi:MAG: dihydrolipoamide acetyltransferase family protein [Phycisphaerae bacterium]|nr:dihydrolipoamide acetyltransferase family protein [Phycisphaerae bacterium]